MIPPETNITEKFALWVKGLSAKEARISVFNHIRDIPYYLVPQIADPCAWAESILKLNKGSCSPKHYLLGIFFTRLGIPVKYVTYPFKWGKQPIQYPPELMELARGSPIGYHVACKARLNDKWVLVDATWDRALKKAGFSVNDPWDGLSDTLNAVVPFEEVIHESLEARLEFVTEKRLLYTEEEKLTYARFIEKFNLWLESVRKNIRGETN